LIRVVKYQKLLIGNPLFLEQGVDVTGGEEAVHWGQLKEGESEKKKINVHNLPPWHF
jgi:hypothetical protein